MSWTNGGRRVRVESEVYISGHIAIHVHVHLHVDDDVVVAAVGEMFAK